jgi:hypothetical protein
MARAAFPCAGLMLAFARLSCRESWQRPPRWSYRMRTLVTIAMFSLLLVLVPYAPSVAAGKGSLAVPKAAADKGKGAEKGKGADKAMAQTEPSRVRDRSIAAWKKRIGEILGRREVGFRHKGSDEGFADEVAGSHVGT